jgi:hypothetical protein
MRARALIAILACLSLCATIGAADALGYRAPLFQEKTEYGAGWLQPLKPNEVPSQIYGACGVAISPLNGYLYLSNYYRRTVGVFNPVGKEEGAISLAEGKPFSEINELDAVCGLAFDSGGNLYANELHEQVLLLPNEEVIDSSESTGVAVDEADNVYVDDHTYVAKYEAPVVPGEEPVEKIGLGSLVDAYGVAVDAKGQRVYVPDAAGDEVKVYEPAVDLVDPVATIDGPGGSEFVSLADASLVVDNSPGEGNGHLLVTDDLKPGAEDPEAAIYEFDAAGKFLDRLQGERNYGGIGEKRLGPIFGEPSGITVDSIGNVYVTTGNDEKSNVLKYGPYEPFAPALSGGGAVDSAPAAGALAGGVRPASSAGSPGPAHRGASASVVVQRGPVRVSFDGKLTPHSLPRHGTAPVGIAIDATIAGTKGGTPPQLRRIAIAINRNGHFTPQGLPVCQERSIQPSTTAGARAACGDALVGEGHFAANVKLPQQSPFPSSGKVLAFNGRLHGKPAILAHIYGTQPAPTSYVLPFSIRESNGTYGTVLEASLPQATGDWGYVTGLKMTLRRHFSYRGKQRSYLRAGCPAPSGFPGVVFPLARTSFAFAGGMTLVSILNRNCTAKG